MRLLLAVCISFALVAISIVAASDAVGSAENATSQPTPEDLDRAARAYRIAVYNTFRRDRAEFERRNAAWRALEAKWKADGGKAEELPVLLAWLDRATAASSAGTISALPSLSQHGLAGIPPARKNSQLQATPPAAAPGIEPAVPSLARPNAGASPPSRVADAAGLPDVPLPISPSIAAARRPAVEEPTDVASADDVAVRRPAPAATLAPPTAASLPPEDGVDVDEVAIRVAGHNLALATLSEELRSLEGPTIEQLAALVERLESHAVRAGDLSPYYALVDQTERERLRPLASLDESRRLLDEKISHAIAATTADATIPETTRTEQLARLAELRRRTNQLDTAF